MYIAVYVSTSAVEVRGGCQSPGARVAVVLSCLLCRSSRQMLLTSLPSPQCLFSLVFFTINCKYVADFDKCSQSLVAVFTVMALKVF